MSEGREEKYRAVLAECPQAGTGVHRWLQRAANAGIWAGVEPVAVETDLRAWMSRRPQGREVQDAIESALRGKAEWTGGGATAYTGGGTMAGMTSKHKPTPAPIAQRRIMERGAGAGLVDLWEASPVRIGWGDEWWRDAAAFLHALFRPEELVFCGGEYDKPEVQTVRERDDWCERWARGEPLPEKVCLNPIKPGGGLTKAGARSFRCDAAIASRRHILAEMDGVPLDKQIEFWWGFGLARANAAAVVFSGNKSFHVVLRVEAGSAEEWAAKVKGRLFPMLESLGCDGAVSNPSRLSRLPGAVRRDNGQIQKLWYVGEALT